MPPPPPADHPSFRLCMLERPFKVVQLKPDEAIPETYMRMLTERAPAEGRFISLTRTNEEVSIVLECSDAEETDAAWRCIKIAGPMDFGVTGVMCNFTLPLKAAGIPVFAVSTWNTDYVLVPKEFAEGAVNALTHDGWQFVQGNQQ